MKLSIWQFLGLIAVLVALYFAYHYWWVDQNRNKWVNGLHDRALKSEDEQGSGSGEEVNYTPEGWNR